MRDDHRRGLARESGLHTYIMPIHFSDLKPSDVLELPFMRLSTIRMTSDCTNGGVTSKYDGFIVCQTPDIARAKIAEGKNPDEILYLDLEHNRIACYPAAKLTNKKWYMAGGNYVTTSDSRCTFRYPIPVHDRTE